MSDPEKSDPRITLDALASQNLATRAIESGATFVGPTELSWNLSAACTEPFSIVMQGRMPQSRNFPGLNKVGIPLRTDIYAEYSARPWEVQMLVPCRKCTACRKSKARLWSNRIWNEWNSAKEEKRKVIFLTLTVKPSVYLSWITEALADARRRAAIVPTDDPIDQLGEREKGLVRKFNYEFKTYVKRLRETGKMQFRYMRVYEYQKQRRVLHVHALLFETLASERSLTCRACQNAWSSRGFARAKLCNEPPSAYLTKYVLKEHTLPGTRGSLLPIYASRDFGHSQIETTFVKHNEV